MDDTTFCRVYAGRIHAGVSQDIRQPGKVLLHGIIGAGKQVPQIMGKHLVRGYLRALAQGFHLPPDMAAVQRFSGTGQENRTVGNALLAEITL